MDQKPIIPSTPSSIPPTPQLQNQSRGRHSVWKLVIGIILLAGTLGRLINPNDPYFESWSTPEGWGFNSIGILFPLLGLLLVLTSKKKTKS